MSWIHNISARAPRRAKIVGVTAAAAVLVSGAAVVGTSYAAKAAPNTTGGVVFVNSPGTSAPPPTLGSDSSMLYSMLPFGKDTRGIGASVSGVTGPAESLSPTGTVQTGSLGFSPSLSHVRIGSGWQTWSNGYKGDVYVTAKKTITITLPAQANAFYFYAEPEEFANFTFSATTDNGSTSGPITVAGQSGAKYFGFYTTGTAPLASVTVTTTDPDGFAIGEFGISAPYQFLLPVNSVSSASVLTPEHLSPPLGLDIPEPVGTPYYAVTSGTVTLTAPNSVCGSGVVLQGDDGVQYTYCFGSQVFVTNGERVAAGTELGLTGTPTISAVSKLHIEITSPTGTPGQPRCPQNMLVTLYDNAVNGVLTPVPNPQDLPTNLATCGL
jgi:murein DD-endopeptidase MepM/ murein hydrolase activator NlpD